MLDNHPAYEDWAKRSLTTRTGPAHLLVNSTGRCNLTCFMCYHAYIDDMNVDINAEKLDPFLENAQDAAFAGSEPLWMTEKINRAGGDIFNRIINRFPQIDLTVFTNGVLFSDKTAAFVLININHIYFSVDTLDPLLYEKIRGKPLLDTVLGNVRRLRDLKAQKGLGPGDAPFINMNLIVMDSTLDGLPDVARKLAELDGHSHWLLRLQDLFDPFFEYVGVKERLLTTKTRPYVMKLIDNHRSIVAGESIRRDWGTRMRLEKVRRELDEVYSSHRLVFEDRSRLIGLASRKKPPPDSPEAVCPQPWLTAFIQEDGTVYGCCANSIPFGNINRQTFDEIWNGEAARGLRASFIKGEMKGCIWSGCDSPFDWSPAPESHTQNVFEEFNTVLHTANVMIPDRKEAG